MQVRAATPKDLDDLVLLFIGYLRCYEINRDPLAVHEFLRARLAQGDSQVFLARDEAWRPLGFVQLYPFYSSLVLEPAWLVSDLYVEPEQRCAGVGQALMMAARVHAEVTGACGLQLETASTNIAAQRLYERLGYVRDEHFLTYWLSLHE